MEWFVAFLIVVPACLLAVNRSSYLLDYAILVQALNRGIRRVVDYYFNGHFNPLSPISLTPLIVAAFLLLPSVIDWKELPRKSRGPFYVFAAALAIGFVVGVVRNRFAAVYSLAEWMSSMAAMAFAATNCASEKTADRWIKTAGWAALFVAGYGIIQYYTIPPWDGMWLMESGLAGYMGVPEPEKMTLFSTMNERGPCGTFMMWAVIPMIVNARWRNRGSWLSVALLLWAIVLTETRSNLVIILLVAILYPMVSKGSGVLRLLVLTSVMALAITLGGNLIPGMDRMKARFQSQALYGENSSLDGRIQIYRYGLSQLSKTPLGLGLGSSGMGRRAESGRGGIEVNNLGDSGYLQIFAQFGWMGGAFFYIALWLVWKDLSQRWKYCRIHYGAEYADPFIAATRAILLGSLVFLFVGDIFAGFSLVWIFFGRALSPLTDPRNIEAEFAYAYPEETAPGAGPMHVLFRS